MIEANELMVGNTYHRKHGKGWTDTIIDENMMGWIFGSEIQDHALNDFEPIILTEEICLRFGLQKETEKNFLYNGDHAVAIRVTFYEKIEINIDTGGRDGFGHDLDRPYLHQLQNIIRTLTGEEIKSV